MFLKTLNVRISADTSGLQAGLNRASASVTQMGTSMRATGVQMSLYLTAPLLLLARSIAKTAGDFEQGMLRVQALSGATGVELESLTNLAKELGATTRFTATDAADALGFMSMAGMQASQSLAALPGVLTLAGSAGLDMATSADIVTNVLAGMGMEVSELGRLNDVMVRTFTRTNTSLQQLGEGLKYVAPVANAAGVGIESVAAALGLMGNAGIQGSMAGTSLRSAISRLLAPTQQIKQALDAARISVEMTDDGSLDLLNTLRNFEPHARNVALLMTVFGQRAGPGMAAILSQGTSALEGMIIELNLAGGTAQRIADVNMQGFNGAMAGLESAIEAVKLAIAGAGFLDNITKMANGFSEAARSISQVNPAILRAATSFAALAVAIPVVILVLGTLMNALGAIFGALSGPIGLIALLVAAAVAIPIWRNLAAEVRGVSRAMENTRGPMAEIARLNAEIARSSGDAANGLRNQRQEQLLLLYAELTAAEARAKSARDNADAEIYSAIQRNPLDFSSMFSSIGAINRTDAALREATAELRTVQGQATAAD